MSQMFSPGDFLVFQLEAGFALLRMLAVEGPKGDETWHVAAYEDLFPDVESAEAACAEPGKLRISNGHIALTTRAFESTQVARIAHRQLNSDELAPLEQWRGRTDRSVSDRSVRLMLGLR